MGHAAHLVPRKRGLGLGIPEPGKVDVRRCFRVQPGAAQGLHKAAEVLVPEAPRKKARERKQVGRKKERKRKLEREKRETYKNGKDGLDTASNHKPRSAHPVNEAVAPCGTYITRPCAGFVI